MNDVTALVNWDSTDAVAIARQITQRLLEAKRDGVTVALAAVMVFGCDDGDEFEAVWSEMRPSDLGWAGMRLVRAAEDGGEG